ncbi:MAG: cadmium-translocating P-type ATPase [Thermoanaerobaculia bacterium]|nr:cadmium-translocating P-type ATPase [Thermoanaerobaculia bacterium]
MRESKPKSSSAFRVRGMDCAEEIAALEKEVGPVVGGKDHLRFNLLTGKMIIEGVEVDEEEIARAVARAGLDAQPWENARAEPQTLWQRRGRLLLCAASGALTAAGLAVEVAHDGSLLAALAAGQDDTHQISGVAVLFYLAAVATGARYVIPKAIKAARALRPDMNLLMTIAVLGAIGIGEWFEAATVAFLFALALLLESWSVRRARRAIGALMDLSPETARFRQPDSDEVVEVQVDEVPLGAVVLVRPGERVPLDGQVLVGETAVDQSPITGESVPIAKSPGDEVFAGTINGDGAFEMRSVRLAAESTLARIISLVEDAQERRAPSEQWVERFARVYTPAVLALAIAIAIVPPLLSGGSGWGPWLYKALVMLVIACPCALVISTPVSIVAGLASAARSGVLIKGGAYLESPARWRALAVDKTGTLTYGRPRVQQVIPLNGHSEEELLALAAGLEAESTHPLARAILTVVAERSIEHSPATGLTVLPGRGAEGILDGKLFWIGSHRLMEEKGTENEEAHRLALELEDAGHSLIAVGNESHVCGLVGVADEVRPEAGQALRALKALGISPIVMLTGDNQRTADAVAAATGVDDARAELLPQEKVDAVSALGKRFGQVAMVGDGVNDAPAMAASFCGVAMGAAGTDAALETADIALMSDDLSRLPWLVQHSRRTVAIVRQNIIFALAVKGAFMILAVLGLASLWMAIAADMGASLMVIFNGLRLLRSRVDDRFRLPRKRRSPGSS